MSPLRRLNRAMPTHAGFVFAVWLVASVACESRDDSRLATSRGQPGSATLAGRDPHVGTAEQAGCLLGDTLLQQASGVETQWEPAVPFDSLWHGSSDRWACRVLAAGRTRREAFSVDTVLRGFTARGWSDRTMIAADGPDGTVRADTTFPSPTG